MAVLDIQGAGEGSSACVPMIDGPMDLGRGEGCVIRLNSQLVGRRHAVLRSCPDGVEVTCTHRHGVQVGEHTLLKGETGVAAPGALIRIADFSMRLRPVVSAEGSAGDEVGRGRDDRAYEELVSRVHSSTVDALHRLDRQVGRPELEDLVAALLRQAAPGVLEPGERTAVSRWLLDALTDRVLGLARRDGFDDRQGELLDRLARRLGLELDPDSLTPDLDRIRDGGGPLVDELWHDLPPAQRRSIAREQVTETIADLVLEYGPLTRFLRLPDLEEIMVVSPWDIYVARAGVLELTGRTFVSLDACLAVLERIVVLGGRRIDRSQPTVDVRLKDGSRVNAIIPPLALRGPCITIRRFPKKVLTLDELARTHGTLGEVPARFLTACVRARLSLLISGGTGSGKTTLLGALSAHIGPRERIVTIEDTAELRLPHRHVVTLQAAPPNSEGRGGTDIRELLRNALRMRPDRIIVGECRGPEAFDMVQAMSTGHDGSMSTVHANSSAEAMSRLQAMMSGGQVAGDELVRFQIGHAIRLVVQIRRLEDGRRRVTEITEVVGYDAERDELVLEPIYRFSHRVDALRYTGYVPTFVDLLAQRAGTRPGEVLQWR